MGRSFGWCLVGANGAVISLVVPLRLKGGFICWCVIDYVVRGEDGWDAERRF